MVLKLVLEDPVQIAHVFKSIGGLQPEKHGSQTRRAVTGYGHGMKIS
jgi:hypothetical protein